MRNKQIVDSWNKIEPDSAADARMLGAILARNQSGKSEKRKVSFMNKAFNLKRLAPVAACLIMVVALVGVFGNNAGLFDGKTYTAEMGEGTLTFYKKSVGTGSMAFELGIDGTTRDLTAEENTLLFGEAFGDYTVSSHGFFSIGDKYGPDKSLLHVVARAMNDEDNYDGGMKIIFAASSLGYISDTLIETGRKVSEVNGVQVSAGYWITRANSRDERNIIYLASYETNGVTVYIECGGILDRSDEIKAEISSVIDTLTRSGTPNIVGITD